MRRQWWRDLLGTTIAFIILATVTFAIIYGEFLLDVTKAHKAGG
jgi:hypothetical protein